MAESNNIIDPNATDFSQYGEVEEYTPGQGGIFEDLEQSIRSISDTKRHARDIALLRHVNTGKDALSEYTTALSEINTGANPEELKRQEAFSYKQAAMNSLGDFIQENVGTDDPEVQDMLVDIMANRSQMAEDELQELLDADVIQKTLVEAYASESVTELSKRKEAARGYALSLVNDLAEERGVAKTVWDWTTQHLFAPDDAMDIADLMGRGKLFDRESFFTLVQGFQSLDPELQITTFKDAILPRMVEAFDDNFAAIPIIANTLFSRDYIGEVYVMEASDFLVGIDVAGIAPGFGQAAVSLGKALGNRVVKPALHKQPEMRAAEEAARERSVPNNMAKVDNDEAAAEAATMSGLSVDAGDILGMSKIDSAMTASPFRNAELSIFNTSVDSVSDEMVKLHRRSIERDISLRVVDLKNAKKGIRAKALRTLEKAAEELPRQLAKVRRTIDILSKRAAKSGNKVEKQAISRQLRAPIAEAKSLSISIKAVDERLAKHRAVHDINAEIVQLRAGITPTPLTKAVREAVQAEQQAVLIATQRTAQSQTNRRSLAGNLATSSTEDVAEAALSLVAGRMALGISDNRQALGLSNDFVQDLHATIATPIWKLVSDMEEIAPQAILSAEKKAAQERVLARVIEEAEKAETAIRSVDIAEMPDGNSFTIKYNRGGKEESLSYKYSISDSGVWEGIADEGQFSRLATHTQKILSPDSRFSRLAGFVQDFSFAEGQAARIGQRLQKLDQEATRGLSSKERAELDVILMTGDEQKRIFTIEELSSGLVETKLSIKPHGDKVIRAYYKKRFLLDELHSLRDHMVRRNLEFMGYKDMQYTTAEGTVRNFVAKPRENFRGADLTDQELVWVPNGIAAGDNPYLNMRHIRKNILEWKGEGYQIIEFLEPHTTKKGKTVKFGLAADGFGVEMRALPTKVLNYQPGYVPRIYLPGYHFIKDFSDPTAPKTLFAAETRRDADEFAAEMRASLGNDKISVKADREMTVLEKMVIDADEYGGLYTGARKSSPLMVRAKDGVYRPERVGTGEAIQRYMANIASIMPMNEYRSTVMQRWANSVDALAKREGRQGLTDKKDFMSEIDLSPGKKAMMEDARDYISNQLRVNTTDEKVFSGIMQSFSDSLYGGKNASAARNMARSMTRGMIGVDPVQAIKGFVFNAQLGMFNVRQLVVQVQNAAVAAAVDPKHAPAALADALAMRTMALGAKKDWPGLIAATAKSTGRSEQELKEMVEMFDKTGLFDSIKRTADYDAQVVSIGGSTMAGIRKVAEKGRIFFTEGELFARLISFNIARRRLGQGASVRDVFDEHLRISMNMQTANAATWQKNWLGIPLQYSQVFAKFYEALIPSLLKRPGARWTRGEAARVLGAQIGLYGSIGVPMASETYAYLADLNETTPDQIQKEMPWVEEMYHEGLTGMLGSMLGFENNFSKDLSLVTGTSQNNLADLAGGVYDFVTTGSSGVDAVRMFTGPSAAMVQRFGDVGSAMVQAAYVLKEDPTLETFGSGALDVADALVGISSSWTNARKATFLHDVGVVSRQGNVLISPSKFGGMNLQTQLARSMGFETDIETAYWATKDYNRGNRLESKETLSDLKKVHLQFMRDGNVTRLKKLQSLLLIGKTSAERRELLDSVNKGMTGDDDFDRQVNSYNRDYIISGGRHNLHPATASFEE